MPNCERILCRLDDAYQTHYYYHGPDQRQLVHAASALSWVMSAPTDTARAALDKVAKHVPKLQLDEERRRPFDDGEDYLTLEGFELFVRHCSLKKLSPRFNDQEDDPREVCIALFREAVIAAPTAPLARFREAGELEQYRQAVTLYGQEVEHTLKRKRGEMEAVKALEDLKRSPDIYEQTVLEYLHSDKAARTAMWFRLQRALMPTFRYNLGACRKHMHALRLMSLSLHGDGGEDDNGVDASRPCTPP